MWWIRKKKKCACPCHYRSIGQLNPPDVHCAECPKFNREAQKRRRESTTGQRSILIKELDKIFSDIIRIQGDWRCIKCGRQYLPEIREDGELRQKLMTTSHYFSRGKFGARWDKDNCDPICLFCHQRVENHKKEWVGDFHYEKYIKQKLGDRRFTLLQYKAEGRAGYSLFDLGIMKQQLLRERSALL